MQLDLIIPTYNRAILLTECLKSVARAVRPVELDITVIIVDNNSADQTHEIVRQFLGQDTLPCRYIFVKRRGKSAALNEAISQTTSELVGFIDDDEQIDPTWLQVIHREFCADPTLEYIGGPYEPDCDEELPDWLPCFSRGAIGVVPRPHRIAFSPEFEGILMGGNAVFRRRTLEKVLPYPEELGKICNRIRSGEDEVIYHRLLSIGAKGIIVPDLIIYHWIPTERLTKHYFRRWTIGRGISVGYQLRERGFDGPALLGVPRYKFGDAVQGIWSMSSAKTRAGRFSGELTVLDCLATLYGRLFYGNRNVIL